MKIFVSYKQTGVEKKKLIEELSLLKEKLEKGGNEVFIYYFMDDGEDNPEILNKRFLDEIKKADMVLAYVNYAEKSEGQLLELGMSYGLGKKIVILVNKKVKENYYLIYGLGKVIEFDDLSKVNFNF